MGHRIRLQKSFTIPSDLAIQVSERIQLLGSTVRSDYLKSEILSKYVSPDTDPAEVRRNRAINKWLATERENEATNDRLLTTPADYQILPRVEYESFMDWCRNLVCDILGATPPVDALIGSFSGGASTSRNRTESHPSSKYLGQAHVTARCLELWNDLVVPEIPGWLQLDGCTVTPIVVPGNVMFTVPKKTDIDRVACKEPDLNMFIQKGIGRHIRAGLRRVGIDLNDQSVNQRLARKGSIDGSLATMDLSSASDSVSSGLVAELLPCTWFTLLDASRCQVTSIYGEEHRNHMFSSMGNGFTFELESLLFYVLVRATAYFTGTRGIVSVYGDDIICPAELFGQAERVLGYFGFQVNPDKSYHEGPFRESCGGHYHNGLDITPFYIKEPISDLPSLIDVANKLRKWASWGEPGICDPEVEPLWLFLKAMVPRCLWGGHDLAFRYQLVSQDEPQSRLHEKSRRRDSGIGGYAQWLNATWVRESASDGVETSTIIERLEGKYRFRPVRDKTVPRLPAWFSSESCDDRVELSVAQFI